MAAVPFTEEDLHDLYLWVDEIPLSRPKRNIARDFADGCCVAEIVKFFFPKIVDLHNYVPAMSMSKKRDNWRTLNAKVFRKLYFEVPEEEIADITAAVPGAVERFLRALRIKISQIKAQRDEMLANRISWGNGQGGDATERAMDEFGGPMDAFYNHDISSRERLTAATTPAAATGAGGRPASSSARGSLTHNPTPPQHRGNERGGSSGGLNANEQQRLVEEKDRTIMELRETVGILSEKIMKLEELVKVKDEKLNQYRAKFGKA